MRNLWSLFIKDGSLWVAWYDQYIRKSLALGQVVFSPSSWSCKKLMKLRPHLLSVCWDKRWGGKMDPESCKKFLYPLPVMLWGLGSWKWLLIPHVSFVLGRWSVETIFSVNVSSCTVFGKKILQTAAVWNSEECCLVGTLASGISLGHWGYEGEILFDYHHAFGMEVISVFCLEREE